MKIGIIVQCRMSSSRLPGKVLHRVQGKPMLQYILESLAHCRQGQLVVATSSESEDLPIVEFCRRFGVACHTGSLPLVAERFAGVVKALGFDCFVRVCGDSPLLDYRLVDVALTQYIESGKPMVSNVKERTFPKGQSVEVLEAAMYLDNIGRITAPGDQEHVTPWFYANLAQGDIVNIESGGNYGDVQQSVDTAEDMAWFESVVARMNRPHWEYSYKDLLAREGARG